MSSRERGEPPATRPSASGHWWSALVEDRALVVSVAVSAILLVLIAVDASPLLRGPSPAPGGWRWPFRDGPVSGSSGVAVACSAGLLAIMALSAAKRLRAATGGAIALLAAATLLGFGLQWGLLELSREGGATRALVSRTMSPDFTSHYTAAVAPVARDVPAFLDHHARLVAEAPPSMVHFATHPPGAPLYYRAVLALCEASTVLTAYLVDQAGKAGFTATAGSEAILATALLSPVLLMWIAALSCFPVAALALAAGADREVATRIGIAWPAIPGVALIHPEIDQLMMCLVAAALALLAWSFRGSTSRTSGALLASLSGVSAGLAVFVGYGAGPFMAIAGLATLAMSWPGMADRPRALLHCALASAVALIVVLLPIAWGYDLLESLNTSLEIHRIRFTQPRSHWEWIFFNFWDFAVVFGLALSILCGLRLADAAGRLRGGTRWPDLTAADRLLIVNVLGLILLDLSGTVRGETSRLWIPMMAPLAVGTLVGWAGAGKSESEPRDAPPLAPWLVLCGALLASCWVIRISWEIP